MESLHITAIQTALHWENPEANYSMFEKKISTIHSTDLVVLPEMFTTGFSMNTSIATLPGYDPLAWMKHQASACGVTIVGSYMVQENNKFFNRLSAVSPDGEVISYNKKHLFTLAGEQQHYTAGKNQVILSYKGWKLAMMICYDLRFPVWCRRTPKFNYDALIFAANWPDRRSYAWRSLLLARAIENQAYVIGVNRVGTDGAGVIHSGDSAIIDPLGKYISLAPSFEETIIHATIHKTVLDETRQRLPFFDDRDNFEFIEA
ncbi:MAG: amidohydrolase [Flavobacteriales bacterium]|nr:amidohydrolase [Flavobacteriales bacterium]